MLFLDCHRVDSEQFPVKKVHLSNGYITCHEHNGKDGMVCNGELKLVETLS